MESPPEGLLLLACEFRIQGTIRQSSPATPERFRLSITLPTAMLATTIAMRSRRAWERPLQHDHRLMIGRFADWFNSRRWFIRYLLYAEWCLLVTLVSAANRPLGLGLAPLTLSSGRGRPARACSLAPATPPEPGPVSRPRRLSRLLDSLALVVLKKMGLPPLIPQRSRRVSSPFLRRHLRPKCPPSHQRELVGRPPSARY